MSGDLSAQTPVLAWAEASARGALEGLAWVGVGQEESYALREGADGAVRWHGQDRRARLPPPIADAMGQAEAEGAPTAWEGLTLTLARAEWLVASRGLLWTPSSPAPRLLARLVEAAGVEPVLHRGDPDRLRRLAALLPRWTPRRGRVDGALTVLAAAGAPGAALVPPATDPRDEDSTAASPTAGEVFAAHGGAFWAKRQVPDRDAVLRISGGLLRYQPRQDASTALRREDLVLRVGAGLPSARDLFRLLPAWTVARPVAPPAAKE